MTSLDQYLNWMVGSRHRATIILPTEEEVQERREELDTFPADPNDLAYYGGPFRSETEEAAVSAAPEPERRTDPEARGRTYCEYCGVWGKPSRFLHRCRNCRALL